MTYLNDAPEAPKPTEPAAAKKPRRWLKITAIAGLVLATGVIGFGVGRVTTYRQIANFMGHGPSVAMGGVDSDRMEKRAAFITNRFLSRVDATVEQKEKITAIMRNAMTELQPLRERHRAARMELTNALTSPVVDRARIEQMRVTELATAEILTRKMADYLVTAAEVLTPDQRQQLATRVKDRRGWNQS
jgi:periplasmic protein CpxP/Spy